MKTMRKKRRVLAKISSRHGTRDLPCKIPKTNILFQIAELAKEKGIERASISQDKEWQEPQSQSISGLRMHPYRNR